MTQTTSSNLPSPVQNLLVDLDGTILGNRNLPMSFGFVKESLGALTRYTGLKKAAGILLAAQREFKKPSKELTNDLRALGVIATGLNLTIEETRKLVRESLTTIFPKLERHFYPIDGAKDFLDWAQDRYTLSLATNPVWPQEIVDLRVQWAGIDPQIFQHVTLAKTMHACKPALAYYEEILAQTGFKPEDTLLVGNEIKMDLPAVRAGISVFIVGPYKRLEILKLKGAKAPSWKGSYRHLRELLERAPSASRAG